MIVWITIDLLVILEQIIISFNFDVHIIAISHVVSFKYIHVNWLIDAFNNSSRIRERLQLQPPQLQLLPVALAIMCMQILFMPPA